MRIALVTSVLVGVALIIFVVVLASKRSLKRRKERLDLIKEVRMLRNVFTLVENEVDLQERAGYSDVTPFRHLLNDYKELLP